ncbi:MAG TPA: hypothetical protein VGY54_17315, partial [Polyangiaceae bacterium]|nr:hypothetical protein [Polyangiaceae bacterium]
MKWKHRIFCVTSAVVQGWACGGQDTVPPAQGPGSSGSAASSGAGNLGSGTAGGAVSGNFSAGGLGAAGADSSGAGSDAQTGADTGLSEAGTGADGGTAAPPIEGGAETGAVSGQLVCNPGAAGNGQSRLSTGDPPEWQLKAGVTAGKLTPRASFLSSAFGKHFPYVIYTSANYVMGQPATFLVFGDGGLYLSGFHTPTVLDNLAAAGDIPPTVGLFIDPPSDGDRVQTYDPPIDTYPTFLVSEIIPSVITGKYSVSNDPNAWVVIGYSASGGQGWNVVWKRPDSFHKFIGHSASVGAANVAMY